MRDGVSVSVISWYSMSRCEATVTTPRAGSAPASLVAVLFAATLAAQMPGTHPVSGRRYAPVMGYQGVDWLERPERMEEEEPDSRSAS